MSAEARAYSTRAKVIEELLDTPAVQEIVRERFAADSPRVGALEAAVRRDPELALGMVVAAVERVNGTARMVREVAGLVGSLPAPFVREVVADAWRRVDGLAVRDAWAAVAEVACGDAVDSEAMAAWASERLATLLGSVAREGTERRVFRAGVRVATAAYARALREEPRLLAHLMEPAWEAMDDASFEGVVDRSLDQVAEELIARPALLRSLGRFVFRLAKGSVRASFDRS